jgi:signal transduction histidine kinase
MYLGLRARVVAVLATVSVLTLAVAAVTLLSPLETRLRNNALSSFALSLRNERGALTALQDEAIVPGNRRLLRVARLLARHNGAEVSVLAPDGTVLASTDPDNPDAFTTTAAAKRSNEPQQAVVGTGSRAEAEVAFPLTIHERRVIVAARKPVSNAKEASGVVRRAFTLAALAGLAGALLVGLLLAGRIVSRIRRLRDTALRVSEMGPDAELRPDRGRDEIGDLSRAFATMQSRLREQEQARRAFVATASHELRTPLASLSVMLDMLAADLRAHPADIESAQTQAANAEAQVHRLAGLSAELLDLSRIDAGIPLRSELVELGAVLRSVAGELHARAAERGQTIEVDDRDRVWGIGDPGSVAQIVRILLDNAVVHGASRDAIRTRAQMHDGMAQIVVCDAGPGVPPQDRERIFERFARGTEASEGGFGLGLAIGRELARRMDGDLSLADEQPGARFVLSLAGAPSP